jgi:dihydropteroate synthase
MDEAQILHRADEILAQGATMIDVGAYSSRPGAEDVSEEEELRRLRMALRLIRERHPQAIVSIDTWRSRVAQVCVEECGADIINDISGGAMDEQMFATVARLGVPYILMHMKGVPQTMQQEAVYEDVVREVVLYLAERLMKLDELGVHDVIIDPGFGFAKTLEQNYELMEALQDFSILERPLLVGISRKSMIYKLLGGTPADSQNGTTVLNTIALMKGANILRVHDVREAVQAVRIVQQVQTTNSEKL